jgi:hypothetical protein
VKVPPISRLLDHSCEGLGRAPELPFCRPEEKEKEEDEEEEVKRGAEDDHILLYVIYLITPNSLPFHLMLF